MSSGEQSRAAMFLMASTAATIARTPSGGRITFEVIDSLATCVDDPHRRVAVNMDPTAISESLSAVLATFWGLRVRGKRRSSHQGSPS